MKSEHPRVVVFGTPEFAAYILEYLVTHDVNVVAVVTTPEKEQGRGLKTRPSVMQDKAAELKLPVLAPEKTRDPQFIESLRTIDADIFCVVAYKILPPEVFMMPPLGTFNIHTSLLPKYRGAAPMQWALMNGEKETGITTFMIDNKVDTGGILLQRSVGITEDETLGDLHDQLRELGAELALETIKGLYNKTLTSKPQNDGEATPAPKLTAEDCLIDFDKTAEDVHNKIRGLSPYPAAYMNLPSGERLKVYKTRIAREENSITPGLFRADPVTKKYLIGTRTFPLELLEVQREGKRKMTADEFFRGMNNLK